MNSIKEFKLFACSDYWLATRGVTFGKYDEGYSHYVIGVSWGISYLQSDYDEYFNVKFQPLYSDTSKLNVSPNNYALRPIIILKEEVTKEQVAPMPEETNEYWSGILE